MSNPIAKNAAELGATMAGSFLSVFVWFAAAFLIAILALAILAGLALFFTVGPVALLAYLRRKK